MLLVWINVHKRTLTSSVDKISDLNLGNNLTLIYQWKIQQLR